MPAVSRSVEEGVLIASSAVRMAVKNRIIVGALQQNNDFDVAAYAESARTELILLAKQNEADARRVARDTWSLNRRRILTTLSPDELQDVRSFRFRRAVYSKLASALRALAADGARLTALVDGARDLAGGEIVDAVAAKLIALEVEPSDYAEHRQERIAQLIDEDFAALFAERAIAERERDAREKREQREQQEPSNE